MENKKLPDGWKWVKLREISQCVTGNTPPKNNVDNYGNYIPFVKPPQLIDKPINDAPEKLSKKGSSVARILPINSILVTCIGNLGRTAINNIPVAFNQQINAILPAENFNSKFMFYQTQSLYFKTQLEDLASATTISIVNKGKFETIKIYIPPLPEQHRIVARIEELFSELDKGVEILKGVREKLKIYRQAVLKWAFEGRFTKEWREKNKLPFIIDEKDVDNTIKIKKIKPLNKEILNNMNKLPNEWIWDKLGNHSFVTKLAGFEFTKYVKYKDKGEIPVIRAQNVSKKGFIERNFIFVDRSIMERLPRSRVFGGEILMVFVGAGLGNIGIVPLNKEFFLGPNVAKIQLQKYLLNKYITYFLSSNIGYGHIFDKSKATAQGSISMENIREVIIPLCSIQEQKEIVSEIESRLSVCDKIEKTVEESLNKSEMLKQSILKKAFEGKLLKAL